LLSMALHELSVPAISFTGSQSGIITDESHSQARIVEVRPMRIEEELAKGKVVIVAGYQGVSRAKEVTTLGRGGSDTSAVALAAGRGWPDARALMGRTLALDGAEGMIVVPLADVHGPEALRAELAQLGLSCREDLGTVTCVGTGLNADWSVMRRALGVATAL